MNKDKERKTQRHKDRMTERQKEISLLSAGQNACKDGLQQRLPHSALLTDVRRETKIYLRNAQTDDVIFIIVFRMFLMKRNNEPDEMRRNVVL